MLINVFRIVTDGDLQGPSTLFFFFFFLHRTTMNIRYRFSEVARYLQILKLTDKNNAAC